MKNLFRPKDRRKIMRNRSMESAESVGAEQPHPPSPIPQPPTDGRPPPLPQPTATAAAAAAAAAAPAATATAAPQGLAPATIDQQQQQQHPQVTQPPLTRRSTLHRTTASLASYRATPITKHYSLNNQILTAFESHFENKLYTVAYAIGLQFVETALLEIPKHGYFYSTRHAQERTANSLNAVRVSNMLQSILEQQHEQPTEDFSMDLKLEMIKVKKLNALALEQAGEATFEQYEQDRAKLEAELNEMKRHEPPKTFLGDTCGPLFDSFTDSMCPPAALSFLSSSTTDHHQKQPPQHHPQQYSAPPLDHRESSSASYAVPPPLAMSQERSVSSMMREIQGSSSNHSTKRGGVDTSATTQPNPPALQSYPSTSSVIPPPPLLGASITSGTGPWGTDGMPAQPEFLRQMSGGTYADHVALERALYLSGLEVQPNIVDVPSDPTNHHHHHTVVGAVPVDDDQWMLEHALKESEREMQKLREQEEQELLEACQASEKQQQQQQLQQYQQQQALFGSMASPPQLQRRVTKSRLEIETLHMLYHEDFVSLWNAGRIRVTHVETYQGKNPGSTNGCTVIAPLLCIHHFINYTENNGIGGHRGDDPGLPDETIKSVVDEEVPSILPNVREELGVMQDAFLIPSDAHDYLLKNQLLSQDQFVTVIGGNILDESHLDTLIRTLVDGQPPPEVRPVELRPEESIGSTTNTASDSQINHEESSRSLGSATVTNNPSAKPQAERKKNAKIACTLFFHEHVVSILKLQRALEGKAWYDIIDSLPSKSMLNKEVGTSLEKQQQPDPPSVDPTTNSDGETVDSLNVDSFGFSLSDLEPPLNTARIRCLDEEALSVAIKWYACAKFTADNLNYIDAYPWDDHSTDFDPRVFQAFVWTEAS